MSITNDALCPDCRGRLSVVDDAAVCKPCGKVIGKITKTVLVAFGEELELK